MDIRKNFLIERVAKHWKMLSREVVESLSLEVLRKSRHGTLQAGFLGMVVFSQRLDLMISQVFNIEDSTITKDW